MTTISERVPMAIKRLPYRAADRIQALVDDRRLRREHPAVAAALELRVDESALRKVYDDYVANVSNWEWAVSWPTVVALRALCRLRRPRRILDLGSGLSTYALAQWNAASGGDAEIVSFDDSADWLAKTGTFLASHSLHAALRPASELSSLPDASFDLVFDDIGRSETRAQVIPTILRAAAPGALVVLDDMNVRGYRHEVATQLRRAHWPLYSLRGATLDPKGRFAMLTVAP